MLTLNDFTKSDHYYEDIDTYEMTSRPKWTWNNGQLRAVIMKDVTFDEYTWDVYLNDYGIGAGFSDTPKKAVEAIQLAIFNFSPQTTAKTASYAGGKTMVPNTSVAIYANGNFYCAQDEDTATHIELVSQMFDDGLCPIDPSSPDIGYNRGTMVEHNTDGFYRKLYDLGWARIGINKYGDCAYVIANNTGILKNIIEELYFSQNLTINGTVEFSKEEASFKSTTYYIKQFITTAKKGAMNARVKFGANNTGIDVMESGKGNYISVDGTSTVFCYAGDGVYMITLNDETILPDVPYYFIAGQMFAENNITVAKKRASVNKRMKRVSAQFSFDINGESIQRKKVGIVLYVLTVIGLNWKLEAYVDNMAYIIAMGSGNTFADCVTQANTEVYKLIG